jgi:hypothetical protein
MDPITTKYNLFPKKKTMGKGVKKAMPHQGMKVAKVKKVKKQSYGSMLSGLAAG